MSELKSDAWLASDYFPLVVNYEIVVYNLLEVYNYQILDYSTFEVKYYKYLEEFVNFLKLTDTFKEKC